jgi:hypothetical protein
MSVNSILDSGNPAESWKNLRVNDITIDSELILSSTAQNVLSLNMNAFVMSTTSKDILSSNLSNSNNSNITPIGITYSAADISVAVTGYYLVNAKLEGTITGPVTAETFSIKLFNDTDSVNVAVDEAIIPTSTPSVIFNVGFSRIVNLISGKIYNISLDQTSAQTMTVSGNSHSYVSIIKLF